MQQHLHVGQLHTPACTQTQLSLCIQQMNTGILMRAKQSCTLVREILDLPCKDAFQLNSDTLQQQGLKEVMTSW